MRLADLSLKSLEWVLRATYHLSFYKFLYCFDGGMPVSLLKKAEK